MSENGGATREHAGSGDAGPAMAHDLILASSSPRRRRLLKRLGLQFRKEPAGVTEDVDPTWSPATVVEQLAERKAQAVAKKHTGEQAIIIGADTIVVFEGEILGKPASAEEAIETLQLLSGQTHEVYSGVCCVRVPGGCLQKGHCVTRVTFRSLAPTTIKRYVATGEPMDKAGSYGIQGLGALLVEKIEGDYFNVVGLPLVLLADLLEELEYGVL